MLMKNKKQIRLLLSMCLLFHLNSFAQVTANKEVGKKNESVRDSLKNQEYPYLLPIWGQKVTNKGFSLPYSAGLSVNCLWQQSDLVINNLNVGFNNNPMHNLDGVVRFDKAVATTTILTVRPDVWLLPFLNVYGIFGVGKGSTEVGYGVWIPDSTNVEKEIFSSNTKVEFNIKTVGIGITPTMGVGTGWFALDMNCAWSEVPQLDKPAFTFVVGPRLGKTFRFKKPERNLACWVGGFRVQLNSGTTGSISLADALAAEGEFDQKLDAAYVRVGDAQMQVDAWWNNLTPIEQRNPINEAKYNTANNVLDRAGQALNSIDAASNNLSNSTVQYSIDKRPKDMWNFIIGSQFQLNKHFMIRAEYGFLTSRVQFLTSVQYRFGL